MKYEIGDKIRIVSDLQVWANSFPSVTYLQERKGYIEIENIKMGESGFLSYSFKDWEMHSQDMMDSKNTWNPMEVDADSVFYAFTIAKPKQFNLCSQSLA
jgi:hypothetical protein